jgi:hypothetical protein
MNLLKWIALILIFLSGCTSIYSRQSDSDRVTIKDHFLTGDGFADVLNQANNYCYQYGKKPVLRNKEVPSFLKPSTERARYFV